MKRDKITFILGLWIAALVGGAASQWISARAALADDGLANPVIIEAREFRLVDAEGKVRGRFHFSEKGNPALSLLTPDGEPSLAMAVRDTAPILLLMDAEGNTRLKAALGHGGDPFFEMTDGIETSLALCVADERASLTMDGASAMIMIDPNCQPRIGFLIGKSGEAAVSLFDSAGNTIWQHICP